RENASRMYHITSMIFTMLLVFLVLFAGTSNKIITLVIDGQETQVNTKQKVLQGLLEEQSVVVNEYDRLSAALDAPLRHGDRIVVDHAVPVQLTADGETKTLHVIPTTV